MTFRVCLFIPPSQMTFSYAEEDDEEVQDFKEIEQSLFQLIEFPEEASEIPTEGFVDKTARVFFKQSARKYSNTSLERLKHIIRLRGENPVKGQKLYLKAIKDSSIKTYHQILLRLVYEYKK